MSSAQTPTDDRLQNLFNPTNIPEKYTLSESSRRQFEKVLSNYIKYSHSKEVMKRIKEVGEQSAHFLVTPARQSISDDQLEKLTKASLVWKELEKLETEEAIKRIESMKVSLDDVLNGAKVISQLSSLFGKKKSNTSEITRLEKTDTVEIKVIKQKKGDDETFDFIVGSLNKKYTLSGKGFELQKNANDFADEAAAKLDEILRWK